MAEQNLEFVRDMVAGFNRADEAFWDLFPPKYVVDFSRRPIEPAVLRGRDQFRAYWNRVLEAWDDGAEGLRFELKELIDAGDKVVTFARASGTGSSSRVHVETVIANAWTFCDGKPVAMKYFGDDRASALEGKIVVEGREYRTPAEALEAVGLSEQDAHADA